MSLFLNCLFIFSARMTDVSLGTLRTIFIIKGDKVKSSLIAFVEITIWLIVARNVLSTDNFNMFIAVAYSLGYATGTLIGSYIEEALAIGNYSIQLIIENEQTDLIKILRDKQFGVSVIQCSGRVNDKLLLMLEISRKRYKELKKLVNDYNKKIFMTVSDTKLVINGYFK